MRSGLGTENMKVSDLLRDQGHDLSFKFFGVVVSRSVSVVIVHLVMAFLNLNFKCLDLDDHNLTERCMDAIERQGSGSV